MSLLHKALSASSGASTLYVEDVFSSYIYTGNAVEGVGAQTITNGINLSANGGLVWIKGRDGTSVGNADHALHNSARGVTKLLSTNLTNAESDQSTGGVTAFNTNGFSIGGYALYNESGYQYSSWSFAQANKFFKVTTVSHTTGSASTVSLSSLTTVGAVFVKSTSSGDWWAWHVDLTSSNNLRLNTTAAESATNAYLSVSGTTLTIASGMATGTYVVYAYAHDTASTGIIQCGSFTVSSGLSSMINIGWEPQWVLIKSKNATGNWIVVDSLRGASFANDECLNGVGDPTYDQPAQVLNLNTSDSEAAGTYDAGLWSQGFKFNNGSGSTSYVYIAIRRGPMRAPTDATKVFAPVVYTGTNADNRLVDTGILTDVVFARTRDSSSDSGFLVGSRLRADTYSRTGSSSNSVVDADSLMTPTASCGNAFSSMVGFGVGNDATANVNVSTTSSNQLVYAFRRAPGFFDIASFKAVSSGTNTVNHTLTVEPELVIFPFSSYAGNALSVGSKLLNSGSWGGNLLKLDSNAAVTTAGSNWLSATSTSISSSGLYFTGGYLVVAYLFATCPGVSKVGSYTGNGSNQTINCGFSAGARFVLIKRTDSTGDWYVWDTARGIVSGNDPHLSMNTTAAEVTGDDSIDTASSGFVVNQLSATNINVSTATYIFLAIA